MEKTDEETTTWDNLTVRLHTHTTHNHLMARCPGLPGGASTRRNLHPLTPMKKKKKKDNMVLFCSLAVLDPRVGHTMDVLSPLIPVLCHSDWLFYTESCPRLDVVHPGHALPRLRAPGIVPCIISFSRQLPCFLMVWPQYASSLLWRCLTVPSLLQLC